MIIDATNMDFKTLNAAIRDSVKDCVVNGSMGQRFMAVGASRKTVEINGVPGNALGAYLSGAKIIVNGNAQDAVGDTMNDGSIVIHGNIGDAAGYAMRGGEIYVENNAGYRAGIHMKEYEQKKPVIVIGGKSGSFLGEYQAGGIIIVLGLTNDNNPIVGNFPCTGMHGGKMFLKGNVDNIDFPRGVNLRVANDNDLAEIEPFIDNFCSEFGKNKKEIMSDTFTLVTPDSENPYKQMYVAN